ncbi:MAG: hypothetical protein R3F39_01545 [Myxococcota bacterium]
MYRVLGLRAAALLTVLCAAPVAEVRAEQVLGADAAGPVKAWTAKLSGVKVERIEISQARVTVVLGGGCSLVVGQPDDVTCRLAQSVGNAVACWEGEGCPDQAQAAATLTAAGFIALPWLDLSTGGKAPDSRDDHLEKARGILTSALASGDRAAAAKALESLLKSKQPIRVEEWPSLLPYAPALGLSREAFEVASRPEMSALGWQTLSVIRVALLRGPTLASAVGRAILDAETACGLMAIAATWLTTDPAAAAELAASAQTANPACFAAWAIQIDGWTSVGNTALAMSVADSARDQFGKDPRLDALGDAHLLAQGRVEDVKKKLEARLAAGERSDELLVRLADIYNLADERTERATDLARQIKERPDDMVFRFFAGVVLSGDRDFQRALEAFEGVEKAFPTIAQVPMWIAIDAFNVGDLNRAKAAVARAAKMAPDSAVIAYAEAEILRDVDRARARRAIARHLELLDGSGVVAGPERERAEAAKLALDACGDNTKTPCAGGWTHQLDSVRAERLARELDKANAELRARQAEEAAAAAAAAAAEAAAEAAGKRPGGGGTSGNPPGGADAAAP